MHGLCMLYLGFLGGSVGKESTCNAGDADRHGFDPQVGKTPGEGNGNALQYSCLENPMDRGFCWATVHWVAESDTTEVTKHAHTPNILMLSQFYVLNILYF